MTSTFDFGKKLANWDSTRGGPKPSEKNISDALRCLPTAKTRQHLALSLGFRSGGSDAKERKYAAGSPHNNIGALQQPLCRYAEKRGLGKNRDLPPGTYPVSAPADPNLIVMVTKFADRGRYKMQLAENLAAYRPDSDLAKVVDAVRGGWGGGEGPEHLALKEFVRDNPARVGFDTSANGETEFLLPSGDKLDVSFLTNSVWCAVEVKPAGASREEVARGVFQCVKYKAVMEASVQVDGSNRNVQAVLVTGAPLDPWVRKISDRLGVQVFENVRIGAS